MEITSEDDLNDLSKVLAQKAILARKRQTTNLFSKKKHVSF